ncbi:hypothetical protein [Flavihumibacter petaseus]|nr:hypothetical protein [Flavihumibacter petaseus]
MAQMHLNITGEQIDHESLSINYSTKLVKAKLKVFFFKDKDTQQKVFYVPSLEVTGYGTDDQEAQAMVIDSINDCFFHLVNLPKKQFERELRDLGWKENKIFHKQYSKMLVDVKGVLKNFNAEENTVGSLTLVA